MRPMRPLSVRYDPELLDRLAEQAQKYRPPVPRSWLMNNLLWQATDPALDWNLAIRDVATGTATPTEVVRRAAERLSLASGTGPIVSSEAEALQLELRRKLKADTSGQE